MSITTLTTGLSPEETGPRDVPPRRREQATAKTPRSGWRLISRILLYALLLLTFLLFFVPLYWMFSSAVKPETEIYSWPITWIPSVFTWQGFIDAWTTVPFDRFFVNSVVTSVVGTFLEIFCAIFCAYAFAFMRVPFKTPLFVLLLGSMMLPGHVTLLVNYITVGELGWLNTYQGIILPGIGTAFAMFLLFQQMKQVPQALIDSARIDGAGHFRQLFHIVLPLCRPMLLTATLIVFMGKWNSYVWPLIVTSTVEMRTLPIGLKFLQSQEGYTNWGSVMAGAVLVAAPMLLVFFLAQKRIIGGIAAGALKG